MTEEEAQAWLDARGWWQGPKGDRLRAYVALLLEEADRQNLISAGSRAEIWSRHIVDSAQLLALAPDHSAEGLWVDLGTGAGLPGIVVAALRDAPIMMIEARPLRTAFLDRCVKALAIPHAQVICDKVERVKVDHPAAIISARAYAPMDRLLASATHLADLSTTWLLPKGRNADNELAIARRDWQALFHVEQSITYFGSAIVTLKDLKPILRAPSRPARSANRGPFSKKKGRPA
jgi:16S rRNA (guanine527-N7)-methyltransferase